METPDRRSATTAPKSDKSDLEVFLRVTGPELLRKHAANILMLVLLAIALAMFLYTRSRNKAAEQQATHHNTAVAYDSAQEVREMFQTPIFTDEVAKVRQEKVREVLTAVEQVLTSDAAPSQKAAAQLAKADVLWQMANAPEASLATSRPTVGFNLKPAAGYLDDAEAAYTELLSKYANEKEYAANALISLGAVAESRGKFDEAKQWYEKAIGDKSLRPVYHEIATERSRLLQEMRKPYTLAAPASQPATQSTNETTTPATTLPAAPSAFPLPVTTMPATTPAGM